MYSGNLKVPQILISFQWSSDSSLTLFFPQKALEIRVNIMKEWVELGRSFSVE